MKGEETQQEERNGQRKLELVHEQMNADGRACTEVIQDVNICTQVQCLNTRNPISRCDATHAHSQRQALVLCVRMQTLTLTKASNKH